MDEQLMKIGEIAAFYNVSVKAIRLYEKKGILKPDKVDASTGYRYYAADQVGQLRALLELKAMGFSLSEIKGILSGGVSDEQLTAALMRKKLVWLDAMTLAKHKANAIDKVIARVAQRQTVLQVQIMTEEERARQLAKMVCVEGLSTPSELSEALWL